MTKRAIATRSKSARGAAAPSATACEAFPDAARIPGIHIAHIGGQPAAVAPIRAYWQARGAIFMHHSLEARAQQWRLEEVLERSHIVFYACGSVDCAFSPSLKKYCERTEKPLILLQENSVPAVTEALTSGVPLP